MEERGRQSSALRTSKTFETMPAACQAIFQRGTGLGSASYPHHRRGCPSMLDAQLALLLEHPFSSPVMAVLSRLLASMRVLLPEHDELL